MRLSTHYYVLSLSEEKNWLFECFRDTVIDVHNHEFPVEAPAIHLTASGQSGDSRLRTLLARVDRRFHRYYEQEPLRLVVVGEERVRSLFNAITAHRDIITNSVDGDHTSTSLRDMGQIVWPLVKGAMSGLGERSLRVLARAEKRASLVAGLEEVCSQVEIEPRTTLFVEEDFQVTGTVRDTGQGSFVSCAVDVREVVDDVVDRIVERVMEADGRVIFMTTNSLRRYGRIALLPPARRSSSL